MKFKYKGESPICQEIRDRSEYFIVKYHPNCCRFPKACSSSIYELYPEDDLEQPKKLRICRVQGLGPGTIFDWQVYGLHPGAPRTVTLLKYFPSIDEAQAFANRRITWEQLLKEEGLLT